MCQQALGRVRDRREKGERAAFFPSHFRREGSAPGPRSQASKVSKKIRIGGWVGMDKKRVLLVDGSEDFAEAVAEVLREEFQVQICHEGREALQLLETYRPHVMVLDLYFRAMTA